MTASHASIAAHRQGQFSVAVRSAAGHPLPHAVVTAEQTAHAFGFGTAVAERYLRAADEDGQRYRQYIADRFNMLVAENAMKWYATEREQDQLTFAAADALAAYARQHAMRLRGHCLVWEKSQYNMPWLHALPPAEIRRRMLDHIDTLCARYRGHVISWDVNNEMLDGDFYQSRFTRDVWVEMFQRAHAADPDALLFVNEYSILESEEKTNRYINLIEFLLDHGAPVSGIGVQEHGAARYAPGPAIATGDQRAEEGFTRPIDPAAATRQLDQLARFGLPIHLTEISIKTHDRQHQADALERFLTTGYAHPAVQAILLWGFWEKSHWMGPDAALVDAAWRPHPAAQRFDDLLARWTTSTSATTDATGRASFHGTFGTYRLTARLPNGNSVSARADLTAPNAEAQLVVTP